MTDRYIVTSVTGYTIGRINGHGGTRRDTSYSVLDTAYAHREVARFYAGIGAPSTGKRKARAEELAAHLNALDRAWQKVDA
jgi:hypothetical protein